MFELITAIILCLSVLGMAVILFRKIPALVELPPQSAGEARRLGALKGKVKEIKFLNLSSIEVLLQKILSKVRILTLKTESKTGVLLGKLRQRSIEKKNNFSGDYWRKIKGKR